MLVIIVLVTKYVHFLLRLTNFKANNVAIISKNLLIIFDYSANNLM